MVPGTTDPGGRGGKGERNRVFRRALPSALLVFALAGLSVQAGNPIGELQYRAKCTVGGKDIAVVYEYQRNPATVGVRFDGNTPVLSVNEREAFEQPFEVVAFEYLSACAQAERVMRSGNPQHYASGRNWPQQLVFDADCSAIAKMQQEGLLRGARGYSEILEAFEFRRAKQSYHGVDFDARARNIRARCPF